MGTSYKKLDASTYEVMSDGKSHKIEHTTVSLSGHSTEIRSIHSRECGGDKSAARPVVSLYPHPRGRGDEPVHQNE
jgi:hypothetical protein